MASRLLAGGLLLASGLIAWLAITSSLAARVLQAVIGISVVYVGYLAFRGWQLIREAVSASSATPGQTDAPLPDPLPFVSVIVPARDEAGVIGNVVGDLVRQRYGPPTAPRYEVIVVDDGSADGTGSLAAQAAQGAGAPDGVLCVLPRGITGGARTKGAALQAAIEHTRGEIVAAVDADARVSSDFLSRIIGAWQRDPSAAALQARREPTNARHSWLSAAQGEEQVMDLASQCGRRQVDGTAELRGNGMFVRRAVLDRLGGWNPRAITEDLELSTRLAAAGEHVALAPEVGVGEEAVETLGGLWWQRIRWADGSLRRLMDHGPRLLAGSAPLGRKLDFLAFSGEFLIPPLFAMSIVASLISIPLPVRMDWTVPISLFAGYGSGSFLLALAGLAGVGVRGAPLLGRSVRGALFLSHWLVVVPAVLAWITVGPATTTFRKTPRSGRRPSLA